MGGGSAIKRKTVVLGISGFLVIGMAVSAVILLNADKDSVPGGTQLKKNERDSIDYWTKDNMKKAVPGAGMDE